MANSSIMIDLDDPRSVRIADVLSNKTSKKILGLLAEGEKSAGEIAEGLGMRLNTVGYNMKKLVGAGLVERTKRIFWSARGKKIEIYRISNKRIVISPKKLVKGVLPALVVVGVGALGIRAWTASKVMGQSFVKDMKIERGVSEMVDESSSFVASGAGDSVAKVSEVASVGGIVSVAQSAWLWFLAGALVALLVYLLWNVVVKNRRGFK